ncbi:uncharacterized protein LOC122001394 [Zingiber officinale]|uniref:Uncharacterized protein n=1 Tax=Zingiber officinale TaxID=94328 RepID=A0A8J5FN62_ZINOF|nr:uncharacterized protein LOC122001394 [Zingiber officinale]KAG6492583.1 hypothetical protein ZIOFF_047546 [Zingiber officinale]
MPLPLREVLRRFCVEFGWSYAVFWRVIPSGDQMLLNWGDGHCERIVEGTDISIYQNPTEGNVIEHICRSQNKLSTLVNTIMVSEVHVMGAGIVGKAALTGTHQWIFQCDLNDYCLVLAELNKQFSAGIQTLAIIPVPSHGVLQFGSVNMVIEDISFVNFTRDLFTLTRYVPAAILSDMSSSCLNEKVPEYEFPALPPDQSDQSVYIKSNQFHYQHGDASALESVIQLYLDTYFVLTKQNSSSLWMPLHDIFGQGNTPFSHFIELECWSSGSQKRNKLPDIRWLRNANPPADDETHVCSCSSMVMEEPLLDASCSRSQVVDTKNGSRLSSSVITQLKSFVSMCAFPLDGLNTRMHSEKIKTSAINKQHGLSVAKEIKNCCTVSTTVQACQNLNPANYPVGIEMLSENPKSRTHSLIKMFKATGMTGKQKMEQDVSQDLGVPCREKQDYWCRNVGASSEVVSHLYEESLYVASQTDNRDDFLPKLDFDSMFEPLHCSLIDYISDKRNSHDADMDHSAYISQSSSCHNVDALGNLVSCNVKPEETNPDQLLDAVISKFNYCAKVHAMWSSPVQFPGESFGVCIPMKADGAESDISASITDNVGGIYAINSTCRSQLCSQSGNCQNTINDIVSPKKRNNAGEAGQFVRKRVRPGQNRTRSRPKDHQLIQDCLDELREIVPDGEECTIDTLLDKTIKHMLFLQSVINHTEKLKKSGEPRITKEERGLLLKDNFVGGATWAFEIGSKFLTCPIIVEDIDSPCQMLVEMLCEEQGLFLEIADLIRGLGLTILKGVMEARNTKVWARFAVEAKRDVTRMEIVLSLIPLLEPSEGSSNITQGDGGVDYR